MRVCRRMSYIWYLSIFRIITNFFWFYKIWLTFVTPFTYLFQRIFNPEKCKCKKINLFTYIVVFQTFELWNGNKGNDFLIRTVGTAYFIYFYSFLRSYEITMRNFMYWKCIYMSLFDRVDEINVCIKLYYNPRLIYNFYNTYCKFFSK